MNYRARIVAGTALALVMTAAYAGGSAHAGTLPAVEPVPTQSAPRSAAPGILLAQAAPEAEAQRPPEEEEDGEERAAEPVPGEPAPPQQEAPPPAAEEPPAQEPAPPAQEAPPADGAAEPVPPQQDAPPPVAEEPPAPDEAPVEGAPEPVREAPLTEEPAAEEPAAEEPAAEEPTAEEPAAEEPTAEEPAAEEPTAQEPATEEPAAEEPATEEPTAEEPATEEPTAEEPATEEPTAEEPATEEPTAEEPAAEEPTAEEPATEEPTAEEPATEEPTAEEPATEDGGADQPLAPVLDSQKEGAAGNQQPTEGEPATETGQPADGDEQQPDATGQEAEQPDEPAPLPTSDEEAQQLEEPVDLEEIEALRAEEGRRIDRRDRRRERREDADVLREIGNRVIIELGGQVIVRNEDRDRIERDASEVYYEELRRGRTRETVVRPNGVQVVTVYDRYGDIIRRTRIMPDGREVLLVYADRRDRDRDERRGWYDPAADLPPLRLTIPVEEYILDAGRVEDEDVYYEFLDQPPVEPVRRLYSVDEVRYSARVRDSVRRVDLDTITFEFGSAEISEEAIPRLEGVAEAMQRLLEENPGETFLIEGHTDAVGSDQANLALSDQRAEAVAIALTNVFDIPPENLVTQGYGESYLKINTQEPEQENRRVAIRRITPLVAPVASAQ